MFNKKLDLEILKRKFNFFYQILTVHYILMLKKEREFLYLL
jgi:hypothetical protein